LVTGSAWSFWPGVSVRSIVMHLTLMRSFVDGYSVGD
jgi:hypothetical protein